jgi:hypothetical protein
MSREYDAVYSMLEQSAPGAWISIPITYDPARREQDIANVRRACQRWFAQKQNKNNYHMVSQVTQGEGDTCTMYVQKAGGVTPVADPLKDLTKEARITGHT